MTALASIVTFAAEEEQHFEAQNPLLPETKEIIWGGLAFLVVAYLLWRFALPAIKQMLSARSERVQRELDNAAKAEADAKALAADIRARLGDIDAERARLLADAEATAERVIVEGRARLEQEVADLQARNESEMASAGGRAANELETEVAMLAGEAAERIVVRQLDQTALERLVEDFIATVGSSG